MQTLARCLQALGWLFCEIAFRSPLDGWRERLYWYPLGSWAYPLGCWFYGKAIDVERKYGFRLENW